MTPKKHAKAFARLLNPQFFENQILLYNSIPNINYERSTMESALSFVQTVKKCGITTDIRISKGQDVQGGCGQLIRDIKISKKMKRTA